MLGTFLKFDQLRSVKYEVKMDTWKHSKSGHYTVRLGYEVAVEQRQNQVHTPMIEPSITALKQKAWKQKTARKI